MITRRVRTIRVTSNITGGHGCAAYKTDVSSKAALVVDWDPQLLSVSVMFGRERRTSIEQRAKLMGRMVMLLTDGLYTKTYHQFVETFSNPGDEPDETERNARISRFAMRFSPTCWYEATASLYENAEPWMLIKGGGDDCGVLISVQVADDANVPSCPVVDLQVPRGAKKGHDAGAMVRVLRDMPGWRAVAAI